MRCLTRATQLARWLSSGGAGVVGSPRAPYFRAMPNTPTNVSRRDVVAALVAGGAALAGAPAILRGRYRLFAQSATEYSARAVRLVERTIVVDMLNQFRFADFSEKPPKSERWLHVPRSFTEADWREVKTSGFRVFSLGAGASSYEGAIRWAADWNGFIAGYGDWFTRIEAAGDFERLR